MTTKLITTGPIKEKVSKTLSSGPPILRTVSLFLFIIYFELLRTVILIVLGNMLFWGSVGGTQQKCVLKFLIYLFGFDTCQSVEMSFYRILLHLDCKFYMVLNLS